MQRLISILLVLFLAACAAPVQTGNPVFSAEPSAKPTDGEMTEETDFAAYHQAMEARDETAAYTAGVRRSYDMEYEDGTKSVYDLDGVIEDSGRELHLQQHINADGIQSEIEGWYEGGRLYMSYNGVRYYEDMGIDEARNIMLVPLRPCVVSESMVDSSALEQDSGLTEYTFHLTQEAASKLFLERYDIYGLSQYDSCRVKEGTIIQAFDSEGKLRKEKTAFLSAVTVKGIGVEVRAETAAEFTDRDSDDSVIAAEDKEKFDEFVSYMDIDTDAISDADITADYAEATALATLQKRLISRLNYAVQEDGTYLAEFNESESYRFDFKNCIFTYANRTSRYIYNWKGDQGGFGDTCSIDFGLGRYTDGCDESVVRQMKEVKNYFLMELYYCGISLEDLKQEQS